MTRHHITLYVAPNDPECNRARRFLQERGVRYELKDIGTDPGARGELVHKAGNTRVPAIDVDGHFVQGFDGLERKWDHLLAAGALTYARPDDSPPGSPQEGPLPEVDEPR